MAKIVEVPNGSGWWSFLCPGCKANHTVTVGVKNFNGTSWLFMGSVDLPTIRPSVFTSWKGSMHNEPLHKCHLFVTDGKITYLNDTTHHLTGKTIDMEELG